MSACYWYLAFPGRLEQLGKQSARIAVQAEIDKLLGEETEYAVYSAHDGLNSSDSGCTSADGAVSGTGLCSYY